MKLDILIRGGTVYDGLSDAGRVGDVGVRDGRIVLPPPFSRDTKGSAPPRAPSAEASSPSAPAAFPPDVTPDRVIDAADKAVLPGFIDVHSHSDFGWLIWPNATSKLLAGVTTDLSGNCGFGAFPLSGEVLARRRAKYDRLGLRIDWDDAAGYFDRLEATAGSINRAVLVGHGNLRGVTVGYRDRRAGPAQLSRMTRLLEQGLEAGAFGLSSGLIYPPGCFADAEELAALAGVVRDRGGLYASHIRSEGDGLLESVDEFLEVVQRSGCRGILSHVKTSGRSNWPKIGPLRDRLLAARERGLDVWADRYPYTASCTGLSAMVLPTWAIEGTTEQVLDCLADPDQRRRIADELTGSGRAERLFDEVVVTGFAVSGFEPLVGKSLSEIGRLRGQPPLNAALDLLVEDRLQTEAVHFAMSEDNLAEIYSWPFVMVGSDYGVRDALAPCDTGHPRAFGTPAAFLAGFVRERGVCDWPTAARKLATLAADLLGLGDRGRIAAGCWADLVVLDPRRVADRATYSDPSRPPQGIDCVLVNGVVAAVAGRFTGAMPGRVLRKS